MFRRVLVAAAFLMAALPMRAQAQTLGIGDPAPKLEVSEFVKGEAVKDLEKGKLYVVEFWATWCGPCIQTIPHLTKLQKDNKDVTFIGVSVFENDQSKVKPFVEKMGDKMDYRVATDVDGAMGKNWMEAAGQNGIPAAFIINKDKKIAWIGHPAQMDKVLDQVVSGKWDLEKAVKEHKAAAEAQAKLMALSQKLQKARQSGDPKAMLAVIDEATKDDPALEKRLASFKFNILTSKDGDTDKAVEFGEKMVKMLGEDSNALNELAWAVVDPAKGKRDAKLIKVALKAAEVADKLEDGKSPAVADTLAKCYFDLGEVVKAVEVQERAAKHAKGTQFEKEINERLEQFKKASQKQSN